MFTIAFGQSMKRPIYTKLLMGGGQNAYWSGNGITNLRVIGVIKSFTCVSIKWL